MTVAADYPQAPKEEKIPSKVFQDDRQKMIDEFFDTSAATGLHRKMADDVYDGFQAQKRGPRPSSVPATRVTGPSRKKEMEAAISKMERKWARLSEYRGAFGEPDHAAGLVRPNYQRMTRPYVDAIVRPGDRPKCEAWAEQRDKSKEERDAELKESYFQTMCAFHVLKKKNESEYVDEYRPPRKSAYHEEREEPYCLEFPKTRPETPSDLERIRRHAEAKRRAMLEKTRPQSVPTGQGALSRKGPKARKHLDSAMQTLLPADPNLSSTYSRFHGAVATHMRGSRGTDPQYAQGTNWHIMPTDGGTRAIPQLGPGGEPSRAAFADDIKVLLPKEKSELMRAAQSYKYPWPRTEYTGNFTPAGAETAGQPKAAEHTTSRTFKSSVPLSMGAGDSMAARHTTYQDFYKGRSNPYFEPALLIGSGTGYRTSVGPAINEYILRKLSPEVAREAAKMREGTSPVRPGPAMVH